MTLLDPFGNSCALTNGSTESRAEVLARPAPRLRSSTEPADGATMAVWSSGGFRFSRRSVSGPR